MNNRELTAEVLKSNMDSEAKAEVIDLIYGHRDDLGLGVSKKRKTKKAKPGVAPPIE
jgi:hypothetical protein